MRVGVCGVPGAWSTERMAESLRTLGIQAFTLAAADLAHDLRLRTVTYLGEDLRALDAVVVKKLGDQSDPAGRARLHALRELERCGVRIFSRVDVIDVAMDRYRMSMELAAAGLPIPDTVAVASPEGLRRAVDSMGDCILKPLHTSKGRGMIRVTPASAAALESDGEWLVQRFIQAPGRDIGATVVGRSFVGAFYRVAHGGEWMTTTAQGGRYESCSLSAPGVELAEAAARAFNLDYTVVDLVEQGDDFLIYEVSAFGGFRGLVEASALDPSVPYAAHVQRSVGG